METIFMIALAITAWEIGLTLSRQINRWIDALLAQQARALRIDQ